MQWANGVKDVRFVGNLKGSPACVHRKTGVILVDTQMWNDLKRRFPNHYKDIRYFILLHECAHIWLKSRNEKEVDALAFSIYARDNRSHKAAVYALTHLLTVGKRGHADRMRLQFQRAWNHDHFVNKNPLTAKPIL